MTNKEKVLQWCSISNDLIGYEHFKIIETNIDHSIRYQPEENWRLDLVLQDGIKPMITTSIPFTKYNLNEQIDAAYGQLIKKWVRVHNYYGAYNPVIVKPYKKPFILKIKDKLRRLFGLPFYTFNE